MPMTKKTSCTNDGRDIGAVKHRYIIILTWDPVGEARHIQSL